MLHTRYKYYKSVLQNCLVISVVVELRRGRAEGAKCVIEYIRVAAVFAAGIYLSGRIPTPFAVIFLLSLILVLTIKAIFKRGFNTKILLTAFAFCVGVCLCRFAADTDRLVLSDYVDRYVTVTGRVSEMPTDAGENHRYVVTVGEVSYAGGSVDADGKLLLTTPSEFEYGDTVSFGGIIKNLPVKMNENGFDYARYYKSRGIFFRVYSSAAVSAPYEIRDFSPYSLGLYVKCFVSDAVDRRYGGDYAAVLKAVLTGNKKEFSEELDAALDRTGLKRFYYPAYLHIMMFMTIITAVLGFLGKKKRDAATVILLIIYAMFNFGTITAVKLSIMLALFIVLKRRSGYVYYLDVIGMTAIIIGIINPLMYFDAGFVMSMMSSVLIHYFYDSVEKQFMRVKPRFIRRMVAVGVICSVGLIPISAYFWNGVSFYSIFVSFAMIFCVGVILVLSPVFVPLLAIFGSAPVVGHAVTAMAYLLKSIPVWTDKIGFMRFSLVKPSVLGFLIYLLLLCAAVKHIKRKKAQMFAALFTAAALCVSVGIREVGRFNSLEMTFVNVGQGDGAIICAPYRFNVLIDGGGGNAYSDYDPGEKLFLEYLRNENITVIDSAFVSHYHQDHVQGIIAAINNLRVKNVFMPDNMEGSDWRTAIETAAKEKGTKIHYLQDDTVLRYNNGMTIRVIKPARKTGISDDENDTTYVYKVSYGGRDILFTGDMTTFGEKNLLEIGFDPKTDILKVAHHGSRTSSSDEWIKAAAPEYSVISVGENNTYYLPADETLEKLRGSIVYRTDYDGDVRFNISKGGKISAETFARKE